MMVKSLDDCADLVIREAPYVRLLTVPQRDADGRWTAVAQVEGTLALVEVTVREMPDTGAQP
jgi:hypothetical protein